MPDLSKQVEALALAGPVEPSELAAAFSELGLRGDDAEMARFFIDVRKTASSNRSAIDYVKRRFATDA